MVILENDKIRVKLATKGAEIRSIFGKETGIEYVWHGETGLFPKCAPNLFPFIGIIKDGMIDYPYNGERKVMPMTKHGFARDVEFTFIEATETTALYELTPTEYTKAMYPYNFSLKVLYEINGAELTHTYIVENRDENDMYYHIGGHTAFYCNYNGDKNIENYYLEFEKEKCIGYRFDPANNTNMGETPIDVEMPEKWWLNKIDFAAKGSLSIEGFKSNRINVKHKNSEHGVEFTYENLPVLTLWTTTDSSEFICLEPWAGIADFTNGSIKVEEKRFIEKLKHAEKKEYVQKIRVY